MSKKKKRKKKSNIDYKTLAVSAVLDLSICSKILRKLKGWGKRELPPITI